MLLLALGVLFVLLSAPDHVQGDALSTAQLQHDEAGHSTKPAHTSSLPPARAPRASATCTSSATVAAAASSSAPAAASAAAAQLCAFYELYRPQHLSRVDTILFRYKGNEAAIMPDVRRKYQSEPALFALVLIVDYLPAVAEAVGKDTLVDVLQSAWARLPACAIALFTTMGLVYAAQMRGLSKRTPGSKPNPAMPTAPTGCPATVTGVTGSVSMAMPIAAFLAGVFFAMLVCLVVRNNGTVAAMLMERGLVTIT